MRALDGILEVEYGEYPQTSASKDMQRVLENELQIGALTTTGKTYTMEEIYNNDITKFVQNFNLIEFKCTSIE